jgi:hypothetical protein
MERSNAKKPDVFTKLLFVVAVGAASLIAVPAAAEYVAPPPEVIATLVPVYHEGHAVYWWAGHWHYRGPNGWAYYEDAVFLREHAQYVPVYHHYGRR